MQVIGKSLVIAALIVAKIGCAEKVYSAVPIPEQFTKTLEQIVKKPWNEFIPSVGKISLDTDKFQVHRKGSKSKDILGKTSHDDFLAITKIPLGFFKKVDKPFIWGYVLNLNDRPFIAVAFKVQNRTKEGNWQDKDNKIYSIALSYIYYEVTRESLGGDIKDVFKPRSDLEKVIKGEGGHTIGYYDWITSGGDGAHFLGQYDLRTTDVTAQDLIDMATLIGRGSVIRKGDDKQLHRLVLATF
jgi:hypothetical protein